MSTSTTLAKSSKPDQIATRKKTGDRAHLAKRETSGPAAYILYSHIAA